VESRAALIGNRMERAATGHSAQRFEVAPLASPRVDGK